MRFLRTALVALVSLLGASHPFAGAGVAELTLDRSAVAALVEAALPEPLSIDPPGFGALTLRLEGPRRVEFVDGGVEIVLQLSVGEMERSLDLLARYEPRVEPRNGVVRLVPVSLVTEPALPFDPDLSAWLGSVSLPRRFEWELEIESDQTVEVIGYLQGVVIEDDRLRLELSLHPRAAAAGES
jgi:hypothetical protein